MDMIYILWFIYILSISFAQSLLHDLIPGPPGDLNNEKKRWLIIGICLHTIISPLLRKYVNPIINDLYKSLVCSDSIHTQDYHKHLKKYPGTNKYFLNYESINDNKKVPKKKINNALKCDYQKYDYKVTSHVDLSKLFLQPNMAHYVAIDESCDSSALLSMVINISSFPQAVQIDADKVNILIYIVTVLLFRWLNELVIDKLLAYCFQFMYIVIYISYRSSEIDAVKVPVFNIF